MRAEQTVSEMVVEVLARQAEGLADRSGQPFDDAFADVLSTPAGRRLGELADGPHRHEKAARWQAGLLGERIQRERAKGEGAHARYRAFLEEEIVRREGSGPQTPEERRPPPLAGQRTA
jgi:hypothetical protein